MGRKVIVAEDDPVLGSVIHATLEAVGHEVVAVVPTGEEAVVLALSTHPDVVVMHARPAHPPTTHHTPRLEGADD